MLTPERAVVGILVVLASIVACGTDKPSASPQSATIAELRGPWSAAPYELPPALATEVEAACRALHERTADEIDPGYELAVIDARGEGVVNAWFTDPAGAAEWCTDVPIEATGVVGELRNLGGGGGDVPFDEIDPDDVWVVRHSFDREDPRRHRTIGFAGAEVVRVQLATLAGQPIEASLENGWWAVWVPDDVQLGPRIKGYGADGAEIADIPARVSG